MIEVTFFTKDCCPLCDAAFFVVKKLQVRFGFQLTRVDISEPQNRQWFGLYGNDIPVVHVNGREVARHRVSERELRKMLDSIQTE